MATYNNKLSYLMITTCVVTGITLILFLLLWISPTFVGQVIFWILFFVMCGLIFTVYCFLNHKSWKQFMLASTKLQGTYAIVCSLLINIALDIRCPTLRGGDNWLLGIFLLILQVLAWLIAAIDFSITGNQGGRNSIVNPSENDIQTGGIINLDPEQEQQQQQQLLILQQSNLPNAKSFVLFHFFCLFCVFLPDFIEACRPNDPCDSMYTFDFLGFSASSLVMRRSIFLQLAIYQLRAAFNLWQDPQIFPYGCKFKQCLWDYRGNFFTFDEGVLFSLAFTSIFLSFIGVICDHVMSDDFKTKFHVIVIFLIIITIANGCFFIKKNLPAQLPPTSIPFCAILVLVSALGLCVLNTLRLHVSLFYLIFISGMFLFIFGSIVLFEIWSVQISYCFHLAWTITALIAVLIRFLVNFVHRSICDVDSVFIATDGRLNCVQLESFFLTTLLGIFLFSVCQLVFLTERRYYLWDTELIKKGI